MAKDLECVMTPFSGVKILVYLVLGILVHSDSTPLKHLALKISQANVDQNVRQNVQSLFFDLVNLEVCGKFSFKLPAPLSNF